MYDTDCCEVGKFGFQGDCCGEGPGEDGHLPFSPGFVFHHSTVAETGSHTFSFQVFRFVGRETLNMQPENQDHSASHFTNNISCFMNDNRAAAAYREGLEDCGLSCLPPTSGFCR